MKITKQRLKEIIREELEEASEASIRADLDRPPGEPRPPEEGNTFEMSADELVYMGQSSLRNLDSQLLGLQSAIARLVEQHDGGEFVSLKTHANMIQNKLDDVAELWTIALGSWDARQ